VIISPHEQGTSKWHSERLGLPTASRYSEIVTTKGERSKSSEKYLIELFDEIISRRPADRFVSYKMRGALEREPKARNLYRLKTGYDVQEVGLCYKDEQKKYGASPDGLIGEDGGLEIKDAEPHIQYNRQREGWSMAEHFQQIQGGMFICGRQWWDRMSYCENMEPIIHRYERDEAFIAALEKELDAFCLDLAMMVRRVRAA